ncbi:unnamed protein product, partial [Symbiodinium necroappetens]
LHLRAVDPQAGGPVSSHGSGGEGRDGAWQLALREQCPDVPQPCLRDGMSPRTALRANDHEQRLRGAGLTGGTADPNGGCSPGAGEEAHESAAG